MDKQKDPGSLPLTLKQFDQLPDAAEVTQATITALINISDATYWRWVHADRLPKPYKRGKRANRTNVGALRAKLAAKVVCMIANEKAAPVSRTGNGLEQQHRPANYIPSRTEAARNILRDAVIAAGVDSYAGMVVLAAAESFTRAQIREEFAAFRAELDNKEVA